MEGLKSIRTAKRKRYMMQDKRFLPGKGDKLYRDEKYIAAVFGGKRKVLSTSFQNGSGGC